MLSGAILQALPRNNGIHFFQENLTTRLTLFVLVLCFGKGQLAHDSARWAKKWTMRLLSQKVGSYSEVPKNKPFKKVGFYLFVAAMMCVALLLVTQPFSLLAQFIFVVLLWGAAMLVRRIPGRFSSLLLIVLSLTVSARYIWWRYTSTLNWNSKLDLFFGVILLAAETYSWVVLVMGYIQTAWPLDRKVASLPVDRTLWPTVDLMIPTYNEDLSVIKPTVFAALG